MKKYIGTKLINAKPMNRLEYNIFRGWDLPDDENGDDQGYLVEYIDGGKPNTAKYKGYVSWSPKEVFEKAYKLTNESADYPDRVSKEYIDSLVDSLEFKFARIGKSTTTVCEAFLTNGFCVGSGKSACVYEANYCYEDGCKYAKEDAIIDARNKLWELEGYLLKITGQTSRTFNKK